MTLIPDVCKYQVGIFFLKLIPFHGNFVNKFETEKTKPTAFDQF